MNVKKINILLVEDDPGDQKLIKKSLLDQQIANEVFVAESGEEALGYLSRSKAGESGCPKPNLVLLDLNMPGMGGREFLKRIKADEGLDAIPVVILTTSDSDQDVIESYKLYASGYIKKPVNPKELKEVIRMLEEYWFAICEQSQEGS
jgi:CheY-like chemotaxis protein